MIFLVLSVDDVCQYVYVEAPWVTLLIYREAKGDTWD